MDRAEYDALALRAMMAIMFLSGELRGAETRVLDALVIETFMSGKARAQVTGIRLGEISGVNRSHIVEVVKSLTNLGYLVRDEGAWRLDVDVMQDRASVIREELFPRAA